MPSTSPALDARIDRLRSIAHAEPRLDGVLLYGSWTLGEADAHSDIEAYLFVAEEHLGDFDGREFLTGLAPLSLAYTNGFGILAVVFDDLMRGEFHLDSAAGCVEQVTSWRGLVHLPEPERAVLLDRSGRLLPAARSLSEFAAPAPADTARQLVDELANWTLMLAQVLARGEYARVHTALTTMVAPHQLQLCRLLRGSTAHWLTPSRALEADLPEADVARYAATTAALEPVALAAAARQSWQWSRDLASEAEARWGIRLDEQLYRDIAADLDAAR
ncbi:DNA polymerase subunit beta [Actinoalloteichus hymeniacidonis]|uniref:Lincosamide nucleotidyltransferase-like C-terminal domain-containing protein n=1 Tax=Actinoalloteichus hymeniacidonis TaxID=340345 RepID=A0AAC9MX24_9PSEU|nr:DNA polymerase subunit beta [Actinoalloteichus hymeniacidonis]AOS62803.1 hypothetical protein TL08_09940 [Actinoalloteichus hymeniacidonis]MBB5909166.1 lincosamide nucleotidyltransferase [Actinoalloteichus hymeniacidonis]